MSQQSEDSDQDSDEMSKPAGIGTLRARFEQRPLMLGIPGQGPPGTAPKPAVPSKPGTKPPVPSKGGGIAAKPTPTNKPVIPAKNKPELPTRKVTAPAPTGKGLDIGEILKKQKKLTSETSTAGNTENKLELPPKNAAKTSPKLASSKPIPPVPQSTGAKDRRPPYTQVNKAKDDDNTDGKSNFSVDAPAERAPERPPVRQKTPPKLEPKSDSVKSNQQKTQKPLPVQPQIPTAERKVSKENIPPTPVTFMYNGKPLPKEVVLPSGKKLKLREIVFPTTAPPPRPPKPSNLKDIYNISNNDAAEDDEEYYDDIVLEKQRRSQIVSIIPDMTEEEEAQFEQIGRQQKTAEDSDSGEDYDDVLLEPAKNHGGRPLSLQDDEEIYEEFDEAL